MSGPRKFFGFVLAAVALATVTGALLLQSSWVEDALIEPHYILRRSIGSAYWSTHTVNYVDQRALDGSGRRAWNLRLDSQLSEALKAKCTSSRPLLDLARLSQPQVVKVAEDDKASLESSNKQHSAVDGCVLGESSESDGSAGEYVLLKGEVLQIVSWEN